MKKWAEMWNQRTDKVTKKYITRSLMSQVKETQIKTTGRYHCTTIKMRIKNQKPISRGEGVGGETEALTLFYGNITWYSHFRKDFGSFL